jgi:hypothetical protein
MRKQSFKKLTISRETLRRLEEQGLQKVQGGVQQQSPSGQSVCQCDTDLCVSAGYTGCVTCNS